MNFLSNIYYTTKNDKNQVKNKIIVKNQSLFYEKLCKLLDLDKYFNIKNACDFFLLDISPGSAGEHPGTHTGECLPILDQINFKSHNFTSKRKHSHFSLLGCGKMKKIPQGCGIDATGKHSPGADQNSFPPLGGGGGLSASGLSPQKRPGHTPENSDSINLTNNINNLTNLDSYLSPNIPIIQKLQLKIDEIILEINGAISEFGYEKIRNHPRFKYLTNKLIEIYDFMNLIEEVNLDTIEKEEEKQFCKKRWVTFYCMGCGTYIRKVVGCQKEWCQICFDEIWERRMRSIYPHFQKVGYLGYWVFTYPERIRKFVKKEQLIKDRRFLKRFLKRRYPNVNLGLCSIHFSGDEYPEKYHPHFNFLLAGLGYLDDKEIEYVKDKWTKYLNRNYYKKHYKKIRLKQAVVNYNYLKPDDSKYKTVHYCIRPSRTFILVSENGWIKDEFKDLRAVMLFWRGKWGEGLNDGVFPYLKNFVLRCPRCGHRMYNVSIGNYDERPIQDAYNWNCFYYIGQGCYMLKDDFLEKNTKKC